MFLQQLGVHKNAIRWSVSHVKSYIQSLKGCLLSQQKLANIIAYIDRWRLLRAPQDLGKTGKKIQDTSYATPIHTGGFVFYYKHGSEKTSLITSSEGGQLAVTILKYKPTKIIAK